MNELDQLLSRWDAERTEEEKRNMPTANDQRHRQLLISSGEHIHAIRKLDSSYTAEQYLQAITEAREVDAGTRYADAVLGGPDVDALLEGVADPDDDLIKAAEGLLRSRGIDPGSASYEAYAEALIEVSP